MFVNPEKAKNALDIINVAISSLQSTTKLSQKDEAILSTLLDARAELLPEPFKPYNDIQSAVRCYVEYRDMLGVERKFWETHEADVKSEMTRISMFLRDKGDELGVDSFNTQFGTAYRNTKTSYRAANWDEFATWMRETDNMQCVEKRPAKLAVKEILDSTGSLPPGLDEFVEVEFNVRRPSK